MSLQVASRSFPRINLQRTEFVLEELVNLFEGHLCIVGHFNLNGLCLKEGGLKGLGGRFYFRSLHCCEVATSGCQ